MPDTTPTADKEPPEDIRNYKLKRKLHFSSINVSIANTMDGVTMILRNSTWQGLKESTAHAVNVGK
eukprot:4309030-Ditylum_brightwellii.AAC.1